MTKIMILALVAQFIISMNVQASELEAVLVKYQKSQPIQMDFEKTLKSSFGSDKKFTGTIIFSGKNLFLENKKPDLNKIIIDSNYVWNIQYPPVEFGGSPQYARQKIGKSKDSDLFFVLLNDSNLFFKKFEIINSTVKGNSVKVQLKSKTKSDFKNLEMHLNAKEKIIESIQFNDEIENEVSIVLSNVELKKKINKDLFKVKIPKNVQVIEL